MRYYYIKLHDFVQNYSPFPPSQEELKEFQQNLEIYLEDIVDSKKSQESEEHQKNILRDFLNKSFHYDCNTKERIDLAIYEDSLPRVLFEVKKTSSNNQEFPKFEVQNPNLESKAFYESILYFLRENITRKNNNIEHIVLTNTEEFYLIDAKNYTLTKEKAVIKAFKNCEYKEGNDTSTKRFYDELKKILPSIDIEIKYTYFRIDNSKFQKSPLLYQILSPQVLLKHKTYLDANTLNQNFYDELLYILGLEENTQNSKVLIQPSQTNHTLLDSICFAFNLQRDKDFETIFAILTTWNNRLLFLRLLESMLLSFKHIEKPFLDIDCLRDFQALNTLFFDILAKIEESRDANIPKALSSIPYLNSSLFEKTALEIEGKEIKLLESKPLMLYNDSILYKDKNFCNSLNLNAKTKDSTLPLLEYLFAFLHAYNFTTTAQDIKNHTKMNFDKLINSAVLGLVFEKLNGYKEGSFYTPSFITSYMCKQSLEKVVLQKFNSAKNWDCKDLESLKTKLDKLTDSKEGYKEANKIFDSIRICDPAVGSGHFLVSALNELVFLKFKLGILCDENFNRIKDISLELQNDEIVLRDSHNTLFAYTLPAHENIESHKIQKALFYNKRALIESCLFGVDINPNSCEITKLRLWIELLKYSYYKDIPNKRLETLPNIDINIKCGNSLISYFGINSSLSHYPNIATKMQEYKQIVQNYKEGFYDNKAQIDRKIKDLLQAFRNFCFKDKFKKQTKDFETKCEEYSKKYGNFLAKEDKNLSLYVPQRMFIEDFDENEAKKEFQILQNAYNELFNLESNKPLEWRFAFPEVLDSNGAFLGFDLVIGNPPYIDYRDINKNTLNKTKHYAINKDSNRPNIFCYFIERGIDVLTQNGILTFINPIAMLQTNFAYGTRKLLLEKGRIDYIADCSYIKVFDSASTYAMMWAFSKNKLQDSINIVLWQDNQFKHSHSINSYLESERYAINISKNKINFKKNDYTALEEVGTLKWGTSQSGYGKKKITLEDFSKLNKVKQKDYKPIIQTADIKRYFIDWQEEYIPIEIYSQSIQSDFNKPKIVIARMTKKIQASFDTNNFYMGKATLIVDLKLNPCYILGILNSKLANFWYLYYFGTAHLASGYIRYDIPYLKQLPIPKITKQNEKNANQIIALVDEILKLKAKDSTTDISKLESEIDSLVYRLYNLTDEEIKIIEGK